MSQQPTISPVSEETIIKACHDRPLPEMGMIRQKWQTDSIPQTAIEDRAAAEVGNLAVDKIPAGGEVAVGVGSRGIANLPVIVRGVIRGLSERGFDPFIFPAMGSHGGATAEGQAAKLDALGVNKENVGCPIRSTMQTVEVGQTSERNIPAVADANAAEADAIIPINRIKAHTDFQGKVESGLSKMLVIGMGKQRGAKIAHEWSVDWSLRDMLPEISSLLREKLPVVGGIALVEDQNDETAIIEGVPTSNFLTREAELLETAYEVMPTLPFDNLDVLIIDQLGKDISGSGMDTNVIGRLVFGFDEPEPDTPEIKRIYARSLTEPSHGNACGVGSADLIHQDLLADMDVSKSLINTITASTLPGTRVPAPVETDRAGLTASLSTIGVAGPEDVRVARITDTMRLERMYVSTPLLKEARADPNLEVLNRATPVAFDDDGNLVAPSPVSTTH